MLDRGWDLMSLLGQASIFEDARLDISMGAWKGLLGMQLGSSKLVALLALT